MTYFFLMLFMASTRLFAIDNQLSKLEIAEQSFDDGEYQSSRDLALKLWQNAALLGSPEQVRIPALLARIAHAFRDKKEQEKWFQRLYKTNYYFKFDPYKDPPQLHADWFQFVAAENERREKNATMVDKIKRESKVWVSFLPFGVGLFDAERYEEAIGFAAFDVFSLYLIQSGARDLRDGDPENRRNGISLSLTGSAFFAASWGYQVALMVPEVKKREQSFNIDNVRMGLSFVPLGVGQYKNGHYKKGFILGSIQAVSLLVGLRAEQESIASGMGFLGFGLSYGYGIYDAWFHHQDLYNEKNLESQIQIQPVISETGYGLGFLYKF